MIRRLLLLILLVQTMGFMLLTWQIIGLHKYHMHQQIEKGIYRGNQITLKISTPDSLSVLGDEFELNHKMYDVVKVNISGNEIWVTAVEDITEQMLFDLLLGSEWKADTQDSNSTRSVFQLIYISGTAIVANRLSLNFYSHKQAQLIVFKQDDCTYKLIHESLIMNPPELVFYDKA